MLYHVAYNYLQELYDFLRREGMEGYRAEAYVDPVGIATIGVGYNLRVEYNFNLVLRLFGFDISGQQLTGAAAAAELDYIDQISDIVNTDYPPTRAGTLQLQADLNVIMQARANNRSAGYPSTFTRRAVFAFNDETESKTVFDAIIPDYENRVFTQIRNAAASVGKTLAEANAVIESLKGTKELIALVSLKYSAVNFPATAKAILSDNRAEAWFEIRYGSNSDGDHANRRYAEAHLFGLYDTGSTFTDAEAKEVMRMYTRHQIQETDITKTMKYYEQKYPSAEYADIDTDIKPARDYLIKAYVTDNAAIVNKPTIDGEVIVGAGLSTYAYKEGTTGNDAGENKLIGTANNDLIFGEKGADIINGGDGSDVIHGGSGNDKVTGGKGNDYLAGGADDDIYYINTGEGTDTIEDKEGKNSVIINGKEIKFLYKQPDGYTYQDPEGAIRAQKEGTDLVLYDIATGEKLAILNENFQDGDFGIHLLDAPVDPQTTNTITGDQKDNKADFLYDTSLNDRIEAGAGNDGIWAGNGFRKEINLSPSLFLVRIAVAVLLCLCFSSAAVCAEREIPVDTIAVVLKSYADTVGCNFNFDKKNIVQYDIDGNGKKEYVVLFFIDAGCSGGSSMTTSVFAVLNDSFYGVFVRPHMSQPATPSFGFPSFIERIFLKNGQLWYSAKDFDWSKDALCCPSIPVEAPMYLLKKVVWIDEKNSFDAWYWISQQKR